VSAAEGGRGTTRLALLATRLAVRTLLGPRLALLAAAIVLPLLFFAGLFFASGSSAGGGPSCEVNSEASGSIPTEYVPWLQLATSRYRLAAALCRARGSRRALDRIAPHPLLLGGGHGPQPGPSPGSGEHCPAGTEGLDCSGAVHWLLVLSGYPDPGGLRSDLLGASYPSGPGQQVTIWANIDHVFVTIDGRDWGTATANFAGGPASRRSSTADRALTHWGYDRCKGLMSMLDALS
jgi:hypothetical protein